MILPEKYQGVPEDELKSRILRLKKRLSDELVILAHHYQRDDVYDLAEFTGDSLKLAQDAARQKKAKYIVFCGVHFMAEAARIVCGEDKRIFLPDMAAGCPMADMASIDEVEVAWDDLGSMTDISKVIPVTYMNSTAVIKAFCGKNGGIVCTSTNAGKVFDWAFKRGEKILFLPDEHLGRNTARIKGVNNDEISLWQREEEAGGLSADTIRKSRVIVWNGYCHVHTFFTVEHVRDARKKFPDCKIAVHPECIEDVVLASDETGSTEQIRKYVEAALKRSTIVVGTELNMVSRLAKRNPDKTVIPLARSLCPNMFKISLGDVCWTLEELGHVNEIIVDADVTKYARIALQRMLDNA